MKLTEYVGEGLRWVRITSHCALNNGQTQTPNVALYTVCSTAARSRLLHSTAGDSLRGHVTLTTNVCLCNARNQVPTDSEITDLDLTLAIDQNVRGLDVAVNDVVFVFERLQPHDCREGDLAQDILGNTTFIQLVD